MIALHCVIVRSEKMFAHIEFIPFGLTQTTEWPLIENLRGVERTQSGNIDFVSHMVVESSIVYFRIGDSYLLSAIESVPIYFTFG